MRHCGAWYRTFNTTPPKRRACLLPANGPERKIRVDQSCSRHFRHGSKSLGYFAAVDYLAIRPDVTPSQIRIIGQEEAGIAALMAAALDDRVCSALLTRMVVSYMSIVHSTQYSLALEWFVSGILRQFDLPDIAASISPRPVWIMNAVDASGSVLSLKDVQTTYRQRLGDTFATLKNLEVVVSSQDDRENYLDWLRVNTGP